MERILLANGSVKGFLDGKHFNRCKRLHPLVALELKVVNFESFLEHDNTILTDDMIQEASRLQKCGISSFHIENSELRELMNNYNIYKQQCVNGGHSKTPQLPSTYNNFIINHYLNLSRRLRSGKFELFMLILPKITNICFICNKQNYARWVIKYYYNFLNVAETYLVVFERIEQVCFGTKGTSKLFYIQSIHLVLE